MRITIEIDFAAPIEELHRGQDGTMGFDLEGPICQQR